jgi:hypothetical protein
MSKTYYFRCKTNPNGPLLKLGTAWEAKDQRKHPDYEEIDEFGEIVEQVDEIEGTMPFQGSTGRR